MARILYHHRTQGRGAEGQHIACIVRALRALGHEVTVLSPPGIDPMATGRSLPVDVANARPRAIDRLWRWVSRSLPNALFEFAEIGYNLRAWRSVGRALEDGRYDFVYERYAFYMIGGALAARRHGVPFVLEANEVSGIEQRNRPQSFPRACAWFERRILQRCTAIHTVSSNLKRRIVARGIDPDRVRVTANGFDPTDLPTDWPRDALREQWGIPRDATVIGFAGWFSTWDRLDLLLDAFAALAPDRPALRLLLIGDGPPTADLRSRAARLGITDRVTFTGPVERAKVYAHIAMMDVAVLPHSNAYGSPVVMFEFMALGVPIAAPRLDPFVDVHGDGDSAALFDPLSPEQCREAIASLVDSPSRRAAVAREARRLLDERYTWRRHAASIVDSVEVGPGRRARGRPDPVPPEHAGSE